MKRHTLSLAVGTIAVLTLLLALAAHFATTRARTGVRAAPRVAPPASRIDGAELFGSPDLEGGRASTPESTRLPQGVLRVRIVGPLGRPIAGGDATIAVEGREIARTRSDPDGRIELVALPSGRALALAVGGAGWATGRVSLEALLPGEERDLGALTLSPERSLSGRVLDPDGGPVADACVRLLVPGSRFDRYTGRTAGTPLECRTDATGAFTLRGVHEGTYVLEAVSPGFRCARIDPVLVPEDVTGETLELRLARGTVVRGRLVDENGAAVPDGRVAHVRGAFDLNLAAARAALAAEGIAVDPEGAFVLGGLPAHERAVVVAGAAGRVVAVRVVEGAGDDLRLVLAPAASLEGRVHDARGTGIEAARLRLEPVDAGLLDGVLSETSAATEAGGVFGFSALREGAYRLSVQSAAGAASVAALVRLPGSTVDVEVSGSIATVFHALDEDGAAVPELELALRRRSQPSSPFADVLGPAEDERRARTDAHGEATFYDLSPGAWELRLSRGGSVLLRKSLEVEAAPARHELVVPSPGSLVADVVDVSGAAVPLASVQLRRWNGDGAEAVEVRRRTDDFGRASWSGLEPGRYELAWAPPGLAEILGSRGAPPAQLGSRVGAEVHAGRVSAVRLELAECVLRVHVTRAGVPVRGALVGVAQEPAPGEDHGPEHAIPEVPDFLAGMLLGADLCVRTDGLGWATLVVPERAVYRVLARSTAESPTSEVEVLVRAALQEAELELAGGGVEGAVTGAHHRPLEGARVRLVPDPAPGRISLNAQAFPGQEWRFPGGLMSAVLGESSTVTDSRGRFRILEVAAGDYRVEIEHPGYARSTGSPFRIPENARVQLGVTQLAASCLLRGTIRHGREPDPESGFLGAVKLVAEDGSLAGSQDLDPSGRYEFAQAAPGRYRIVVQVRDATRESEEFELLPERVHVQDLELPTAGALPFRKD